MKKILFYYSALASLLITVSVVFSSHTLAPVIFAIFFLPVTAYFVIEFFKQIRGEGSDIGTGPKKGEVITTIIIFLLLTVMGLKNIYTAGHASSIAPAPTSSPLIFKISPTPEPRKTIQISITDGSPSVNIREAPAVYSKKVAEAKDGDTFEYTQKTNGWYEIKLKDGDTGYISTKYAKEVTK